MSAERTDFLGQYKAISAKLKKRFLRKPNVSEASEKFGQLAKELENQECPHYAAFCCLAVARCENTLGNSIEEAEVLVKAARLFLEAEELNHQLLCPSFSENLNGALSCYVQAVQSYLDQGQGALAVKLCIEMGDTLRNLGRTEEAIVHYQKAADLQTHCPLGYISALDLIAQCRIKRGDYHGALNTLTEIWMIADQKSTTPGKQKTGVFAEILGNTEVTLILILLLLNPTEQRLSPEQKKLLEKYGHDESVNIDFADESATGMNYINENLILLLQSFVMAKRLEETTAMRHLEEDMWRYLTAQQMDLLHIIMEKLDD